MPLDPTELTVYGLLSRYGYQSKKQITWMREGAEKEDGMTDEKRSCANCAHKRVCEHESAVGRAAMTVHSAPQMSIPSEADYQFYLEVVSLLASGCLYFKFLEN